MKCFCNHRAIEQTPTNLPVNIQSNNKIKDNVAYYRLIFINHSIVHNKTNSKPILSEQARSYLLRHKCGGLSYALLKASENVFLFQITLKINF